MRKTLKGKKQINRIMNNYLRKFGLKAFLDTDFTAYMENKEIGYALMVTDAADKYFIPFCESIDKDVKADAFLLSIFHEIGHHMTWDEFSDEEIDNGFAAKEIIDKIIDEAEEDDEETIARENYNYFNLPEERAATEWGINYIKTHAEEVANFWRKLQPAIMRFFKKNHLI